MSVWFADFVISFWYQILLFNAFAVHSFIIISFCIFHPLEGECFKTISRYCILKLSIQPVTYFIKWDFYVHNIYACHTRDQPNVTHVTTHFYMKCCWNFSCMNYILFIATLLPPTFGCRVDRKVRTVAFHTSQELQVEVKFQKTCFCVKSHTWPNIIWPLTLDAN